MSIIKLNNRSVKDITQFGSISSLGSLTHIATQTASSSASLSFTSGIDSTYKEYIFYFVNMHPATNGATFTFQADRSGYSSYNQTITSTNFNPYHLESGSEALLRYMTAQDQAQGTSFQPISEDIKNDNDGSGSGFLHLFNPSSTTFVKHFISQTQIMASAPGSYGTFCAGYFNTTNALDKLQFKMSSGNIDSGQILLFGLN